MKYDYLIVDVFSSTPFGGNQLAVLPDARGISSEGMQRIAREFNFSETTFVLSPKAPGHAARVRIFAPGAELPFAGHPTVGTACVLAHLGRASAGAFTLELGIGPVEVEVARGDGGALSATLTVRRQPELGASSANAPMAEVVSLDPASVVECFRAGLGLPFHFARLASREAVDRVQIDRAALARHLQPTGCQNLFLFAGEPANGGVLYARMFAPALGVEEDPATGSACAALIGACAQRAASGDGTFRLTIHQGVAMGRASLIHASAQVAGGAVASVSVGGAIALIADGQIDVPERFLER